MYTYAQYINTISMIPDDINKKINVPFSDFCSAAGSLQFVMIDSQNFVPQFLLQIYINVFLHYFI